MKAINLWIGDYIAYQERRMTAGQVSEGFLRHVKCRCRVIESFLLAQGIQYPNQVKPFHLDEFKLVLASSGRAASYQNHFLKTFWSLFQFIVKREGLAVNPAAGVQYNKDTGIKTPALSSDQVAALEMVILPRSLSLERDRFLLMVYTGLSFSDLPKIKQHIYTDELGRRWVILDRGKTSGRSIILLTAAAVRILDKYNYTIPVRCNQHHNKKMKEIAVIVDIPYELTSRMARRTCAQMLIDKGVSFDAVAGFLGHNSAATTKKYYAETNIKRMLLDADKIDFGTAA